MLQRVVVSSGGKQQARSPQIIGGYLMEESHRSESRNFVVTVKEKQRDQPFFLVFETDENIGIGKRTLMLFLEPSVNLEQAKELANRLNTDGARLSVQWLVPPNEI